MDDKLDVVIPLGRGSCWHNYEVVYSIRSIEKHLKNYRNIYIIGEEANKLNEKIKYFYFNENHFSCKEQKIMEKVKFACTIKTLSENFVFWNDDYFLLKDIDCLAIENCYDTLLSQKILKRKSFDTYARSLTNTINVLLVSGYNTYNYDIHYPIVYNKHLFPEVMDSYDWTIPSGYVVKSLYTNTLNTKGSYRKDLKILNPDKIRPDADMFSTKPLVNSRFQEYIKKLYPEKSEYEI